ncbi:MAG: hypothetical protein ACOCVA_00830 [Prolixibacteraceae bacterium]
MKKPIISEETELTCTECGFKWIPENFGFSAFCPNCNPPKEVGRGMKLTFEIPKDFSIRKYYDSNYPTN